VLEIKEFLSFCEKTSEKYYSYLSKSLQETSHSFGIKPVSNIYSEIIDFLDKKTNSETFSYYFYENSNTNEITIKYLEELLFSKISKKELVLAIKKIIEDQEKDFAKDFGDLLKLIDLSAAFGTFRFAPIQDVKSEWEKISQKILNKKDVA